MGPISQTLSGVKLFMQAVAAGQPWLKDPLARRAPWDEELYRLTPYGGGKRLCFGLIWNDGVVIPHPPIIRALEITRAALLAAGHKGAVYNNVLQRNLLIFVTVIDWHPYKHKEILLNVVSGFLGVANVSDNSHLIYPQSKIWTAATESDYAEVTASTGEPILQSMDLEEEEAKGEVNTFLPPQKDAMAYDLWKWHLEKRTLREEYLDQWNKTVGYTGTGRPMDAVIAPVAANTATPHGFNRYVEKKLL